MDLRRRQRRTIRSEYLLVLVLLCCFLPVKSISSRKHLVCMYRSDIDMPDKEYQIENMPTDLCTHVIYEGRTSYSPWEDQTDMLQIEYQKFADIKNRQPNVKLLMTVFYLPSLSEESIASRKRSSAIEARKLLIESSIRLLRQYDFDGILYESYYPLELIEETKQAFESAGHDTWTVAVHFSTLRMVQEQRIYEVADLVILSVDRPYWRYENTDFPSSLYRRRFDKVADQHNIMDATQNLINIGCPRDKILLRVDFYGIKFELADTSDHGVNAITVHRKNPKLMKYNEICSLLQEPGWTDDWDEQSRAPFAYRGKEWIGYENEFSLGEKANFVDDEGLGGLVVNSIHKDDYKGTCGKKYPLLTAVWKAYKPTWSTDDDPFAFAIFRTTKRPR